MRVRVRVVGQVNRVGEGDGGRVVGQVNRVGEDEGEGGRASE